MAGSLASSTRPALLKAVSDSSPAHSVELGIQAVFLAEIVSEGKAGEDLTPLAANGVEVKQHHQSGEEPHEDQLENNDLTPFSVQVKFAKADVWEEGKGQEEATDKATDVSKVVYPGEEAEGKQEQHDHQ